MILIGDYIVSHELLTEHFLCDYVTCRGICCVEGESGAPITAEEEHRMWQLLPAVKPLLDKSARAVIKREGIAYTDRSGERVTALVDGRQCIFTTFTDEGACLCSFEKLYREGKIDFPKPISCHLYPIRVHHYPHATALNYDRYHNGEPIEPQQSPLRYHAHPCRNEKNTHIPREQLSGIAHLAWLYYAHL